MSRHARIEEISSDDSDSDPTEMDPNDFEPASTKFPLQPRTTSSILPTPPPPSSASSSTTLINPHDIPTQYTSTTDLERFKHFQCLYPVYFDKHRSRAEGRRVGKQYAVDNPLARDLVDAVQNLGLRALFEPGKVHPKDWSNPGRVRVLIKEKNAGRLLVNSKVKNKHHLYILVGMYLRAHPTTSSSPQRLRVPGLPPPDPKKPIPPPAIPLGWKMGTILPLHSPALSGGGVSENFFKDIMAEMQGQTITGVGGVGSTATSGGGGGGGVAEAGGGKKKKDKKKK